MRTIFAFDTATSTATCALVRDGELVGERATTARSVLAAADELGACGGHRSRATRRARRRYRARAASRRSGSGSRPRAGSRSRSTCPLQASRRLHAFAGGTAGDRRQARRGLHRRTGASSGPRSFDARGRTLVGDGAVRYRDVFEAAGADRAGGRRRGTSAVGGEAGRACRGLRARRRARARSTCAPPTRGRRDDRRRDRHPLARPRRPRRDRDDRAARIPHAVVTVDVRLRAREGDVDLPRRVRRRPPDRLRDQLALRRRLARDERRRRPGLPAARNRDRSAPSTSSS